MKKPASIGWFSSFLIVHFLDFEIQTEISERCVKIKCSEHCKQDAENRPVFRCLYVMNGPIDEENTYYKVKYRGGQWRSYHKFLSSKDDHLHIF